MYKFIFVCYENGAGGEGLCYKISQMPYCNTLNKKNETKRTVVYDVFEKALVDRSADRFASERLDKDLHIPIVTNDTDLCHVVPSHIAPSVLKKYYPSELYVVINSPTDQYWLRKLYLRKYRYHSLSVPQSLQARVGEYKQFAALTNNEHAKALLSPMTNLQIRCLAKNIPVTKENCKKYFKKLESNEYRLKYTDDVNTITIEFKDLFENNLQPLFEKIHKHIEANQ